ncbi:MAG: hypothetical protein ACK5JF_05425 [Oscillospiraceae bacterium]
MGWFDGFPFKSREQMQKEQQDFEKNVFPLGMEQREVALAVLREVTTKKLPDDQKLFAFISAKDRFAKAETEEDGLAQMSKTFIKQSWLKQEDKIAIAALILLESRIESLEDYPTAQQVMERAETVTGI